jgi:hypothetical protein
LRHARVSTRGVRRRVAVVIGACVLTAVGCQGRRGSDAGDGASVASVTSRRYPSSTVVVGSVTAAPVVVRTAAWREVFASSTVMDEQGVTLLGSDNRRVIALGHELCGGPTDAALVWETLDLSRWTAGLVSRGNLSTTRSICPWVTAVAATPDGQSFVAVGTAGDAQRTIGRVWRSGDGIHWSAVDATPFDDGQLTTVVSGHGLLVAGGGSAHLQQWLGPFVAWSEYGASWQRVNLSTDGEISQVVSGPTGFLAIGHGSGEKDGQMRVWSSPDGKRWTVGRGLDVHDVDGGEGFATATGYSILASEGISGAKVLFESSDGRRWTRTSVAGLTNLDAVGLVARSGSRVIAIGDAHSAGPNGYTQAVWVSDDAGHAWARVEMPSSIAQHTALSVIAASGHDIFVGGGLYPETPVAAKPASLPRIWSVTIN